MADYGRNKELNYGALVKELETDGPKNLYMFWGPEDYLIRAFSDSIRRRCLAPGSEDFDAKRLDGPLLDPEDVDEAVNSMPFLSERTFVELRNMDINRHRDESMVRILTDIPEWCTVVITLPEGISPDGRLSLVKKLQKSGKAVEFTAQGDGELYKWLRRRFSHLGKTISMEAMDQLLFLSGRLMNQLIPEIQKICAYARGDHVTVEDVEAVAHHIPEARVFQMTDYIASGDFDAAAGVLAELLSGDAEPVMILGALGSQMRQLYAARVALDSGKGLPFLREILGGGSDYRFRKLLESARRFSSSSLGRDLRLIPETILRTREQSMGITEEEALKELLLRFAMEGRNAAH